MFDEVIVGFIRGVFRFLGWLIIDVIFDLFIDPFIYSTGKVTLRVITLGQCRFDNPSKLTKFFIYSTGVIILLAGLYLALYIAFIFIKDA
ncbi:hypothetical protein [Legionella cincinnatiensis]|uniref:Uncharacterized protein n=1 Tax=Legionella cincinnatiensis TaxID=28085 RepID=A0A378IMT5_9GAMM|nr:hypothetical protein [Legionella cincinnatiensis]KTC93452.1 hypothetical protein Lcin_0490 [Legionella cincinnatiensis]STX36547.1 Uncharacterised protein [Legionella cincinnatiensis]